jgi:hypothetical protein
MRTWEPTATNAAVFAPPPRPPATPEAWRAAGRRIALTGFVPAGPERPRLEGMAAVLEAIRCYRAAGGTDGQPPPRPP